MTKKPFYFRQFSIDDTRCAMKVGTDSVILGALAEPKSAKTILDIGTGSGLLALMLAQKSNACIDAIDIHEPSVKDAILNFKNSAWMNRLNAFHISFQEYAKNAGKMYDLILTNPPYFINSLKSPSQIKNLARHTGSLSPEELLTGVASLLHKSGCFWLILPPELRDNITEKASGFGLFIHKEVVIKAKPDKKANRTVLKLSASKPGKIHSSELIIRNDDGSYHKDYNTLTKDYYIHLH